jgi:hypothetical protein
MDRRLRPNHQLRQISLRSGNPLLPPDCAFEAHASFLFPADISETHHQATTMGNYIVQLSQRSRFHNYGYLPMPTNLVLLDKLGQGGIWPMHRHQRVGVDKRHHQHCSGYLDARLTFV